MSCFSASEGIDERYVGMFVYIIFFFYFSGVLGEKREITHHIEWMKGRMDGSFMREPVGWERRIMRLRAYF